MFMNAMRTFAGICALLQFLFAAVEMSRWNLKTVARIAPSWVRDPEYAASAETHVRWARRLAFNMGAYNLMLGLGLGWAAFAGDATARQLSVFFAIWLLVAAAVALGTGAVRAFQFQIAMGLVLLVLAILASPASGGDDPAGPEADAPSWTHYVARQDRDGPERVGYW